jgi:ferrochelatase
LETLEEIAMEGKHQFQEAGGEDYKHIPCLNDNKAWVNLMVKWIGDWQVKETLPV